MKITYLMSAAILSAGLLGFGYYSIKHWKTGRELVEVKGLSERIVKSNIGTITFSIFNRSPDLGALYTKMKQDKEKVVAFLKLHDITDAEINDGTSSIREETLNDDNGAVVLRSVSTKNEDEKSVKTKRYFNVTDKIIVRTENVDKISKLNSDMITLFSEGVFLSCNFKYSFNEFNKLKLDMIKEAAENAWNSAEESIKPYNQRLTDAAYIRQGEMTVEAEDSSRYSYYGETESLNKKIRLIVRAGFHKEPRHR